MAEPPRFRPAEILATLDRHGVHHVLIGALAAALHGAPRVTVDVDITPDTEPANLARLSTALDDLDARVRTPQVDEGGVPFSHDAESLGRAQVWNLVTRAGNLDIAFVPSGTGGYADLRRDAVTIEVRGTRVVVASLADVVRSKQAANREKDRADLPLLRRLLDHQAGAPGPS